MLLLHAGLEINITKSKDSISQTLSSSVKCMFVNNCDGISSGSQRSNDLENFAIDRRKKWTVDVLDVANQIKDISFGEKCGPGGTVQSLLPPTTTVTKSEAVEKAGLIYNSLLLPTSNSTVTAKHTRPLDSVGLKACTRSSQEMPVTMVGFTLR